MITRTLGKIKRGILKSAMAGNEDRVMFTVEEPSAGAAVRPECHYFYMPALQAAEFLGRVPIGTELLLHDVIEVEVAKPPDELETAIAEKLDSPPPLEECEAVSQFSGKRCTLDDGHDGKHVTVDGKKFSRVLP